MRVLVACEFSGVVRDAFTANGHDAWSCDLLRSDAGGQHWLGDVFDCIEQLGPWDMMIAHPPCTYLCSSGLHWNKRVPGRDKLTYEAIQFVDRLLKANIPRIALENPIGCISSKIRKPDQIIQPWQFGHPESKSTCLWLKNLPKLIPTFIVEKPVSGRWENQTPSGQNKLGPSADRWKLRAITYQGIADAMAKQWSLPAIVQPANVAASHSVSSTGCITQTVLALDQIASDPAPSRADSSPIPPPIEELKERRIAGEPEGGDCKEMD